MFCLQYYKGFTVIRTEDAVETTEYILRMADKLKREKSKYGYYHTNFEPKKEKYCEVVKRVKKANVTPENAGVIMLSQIPGISYQTATAVMKEYTSILKLVDAIKENQSCLNHITYQTKSNQKRHISQTSKKNIMKYLMYKKEKVIKLDI
jgi:ERCC4-type nuclease